MAAKGFNIAEECHVVHFLHPVDLDSSQHSAQITDRIHLGRYRHVSIIISLGVTGAAATITLIPYTAASGGSAASAIAFNYYAETTAAGDTLSGKTAATASGFATSTNDTVFYVIELDASELPDGYPWLGVTITDPTAATFGAVVAILSGARYSGDQSPTVLA